MEVPSVALQVQKASGSLATEDAQYMGGLLATSLVVLAQAAYDLDTCLDADNCTSGGNWAVAAGTMGTTLCLLLFCTSTLDNYRAYAFYSLSLLWFITIAAVTFKYKDYSSAGNWATAGNGFFATWGCFLLSLALSIHINRGEDLEDASTGTTTTGVGAVDDNDDDGDSFTATAQDLKVKIEEDDAAAEEAAEKAAAGITVDKEKGTESMDV